MSIVLNNLTKRYGPLVVVNNLSLEIENGELFVLLGGSGSGKSTILRLIAGLADADAGSILLNGRDVTALPPQARGTGFVFQNYSIFRHMTVAENIGFGLRIRRADAATRRRRTDELLDLVGLAGLGERYSDQLSGGQQQRVALARALAYEPDVLLLDEPFGALDVKIRAQLRESLKAIQRQLRVTTILVTHDQEEAFELADKIGVLDRGALVEVNTPQELYHRPHTEYGATFIGGGNVLIGRRVGEEIRLGAVGLPFPADAPAHDPGASVRVLFRPETVMLSDRPFDPESGIYALGQGRVLGHIFAGASERIRIEMEGLQGVRSLSPPLAFGQRAVQLEVAVSSAGGAPDVPAGAVWLGIRRFHVLAPGGLKLLICADETPVGEVAARFGLKLAARVAGRATLLTVVENVERVPAARAMQAALARPYGDAANPFFETLVRQGDSRRQILETALEGDYDLVMLGAHRSRQSARAGLGTSARRVLTYAEVPILIAGSDRDAIRRVLICTAAGEPGKADVQFGGRLTLRAGAEATVLHVPGAAASVHDRQRAERYLEQAGSFLAALGVSSRSLVSEGPVVPTILREAEAGDYDLVVVGAPAPAMRLFVRPSVAAQIVAHTSRPVAVVPMRA